MPPTRRTTGAIDLPTGGIPANGRVVTGEGVHKRLNQVSVGDYVMGVNDSGNTVSSRVLQKIGGGVAGDGWLNISGKRINAGRGNSTFTLICDPKQLVWSRTKTKYVSAASVSVGDHVTSMRADPGLSPVQASVLLGKMLGDAHIPSIGARREIIWSHTSSDAGYVEWVRRAIGPLCGNTHTKVSGHGSEMLCTRTVSSDFIRQKFDDFYMPDHTKVVPAWVAEAIDPIALAFWYMDDGSLAHQDGQEDRAAFATCAFTESDCRTLVAGMARLGVVAAVRLYAGYPRLFLNADNAERLFLLVAPYIPPCMQRKLPARYRGHDGWLPQHGAEYKSMLVEQRVDAISSFSIKSGRYSMETETGNYFANGILVGDSGHNDYHERGGA